MRGVARPRFKLPNLCAGAAWPFRCLALAWLTFGLAAQNQQGDRFLPDDPLWRDDDTMGVAKPGERGLSQVADFLENTFLRRPEGEIAAAENVNTLGEVPDSSWFTNRIGRRVMAIEELVRGPNRGPGPDLSSAITIVRAKTEGVTPGFTIRDSRGDLYFVKFDPFRYPQLATSAEVVATKFFHAFGYHVPENHLVLLPPERLRIGPDAKLTDNTGKTRHMIPEDVTELLRKVPRRDDGTIQALASLALQGSPLGPFRYFGTRADDANDIFPHENRRELRGLRVFAAWLNHDDARSVNSLDTYIASGELGYVRHHLIDFGSCLGSGSVQVQSRRGGNEYLLEWGPILRSAASFGIIDRPWRKIPYPDLPGVGRFEADHFQPDLWKTEYPNPAFERMLPEDAAWAARIVQRFSDDMIEALVKTGSYQDPRSEAYLIQTLIKRRDRIVRHYLSLINPLDDFAVRDGSVTFRDPAKKAGLAPGSSYGYQWFAYDNSSRRAVELGSPGTVGSPAIPVPASPSGLLLLRVWSSNSDVEPWRKPIDVFLRVGSVPEVVGIDRLAGDPTG